MVRASISVFSKSRKPDDISALIGLPYDSSWATDDSYPGKGVIAGRKRKENCWRISLEIDDEASVSDPVTSVAQKMLLRVMGFEGGFKELWYQGCEIEFSIYMIGSQIPAIGLGLNELSGIVALGAYLDIDIVLSE
jgi:hypothetical protein